MKLLFRAPLAGFARQFSVALLSVMVSGVSYLPTINQPARAFGFDAGVTSAAGSLSNCSDSGILVATAGSKQLGVCPLKHTDVVANVSGYVARVSVKQQFHNPYKEKIEAVYTFPLPENCAVDEMTMKVGNRVIKGEIKKREDARIIYETARARGNVASLLDQERPNIFTQSVANIEPGQNIDIEIKYVNLLRYDSGAFTFAFPTVVGPRFIPGHVDEGRSGTGVSVDTDQVPDASRITPKAKAEDERAGHDISIKLNIDSGVPIKNIESKLHDVDMVRTGTNVVQMKLKDKDKIPNKDFVATWTVASDAVQSGYLTHKNGAEGFFTMMLVPPKRVTKTSVQPKEMIFLVDCSGSQRGRPLDKAKETLDYILNHMNPSDSFQILAFSNGVTEFSPKPEIASASMLARAHTFIESLQAHGGTWMAPAVEAACALPNPDHKIRIVTFMTDGLVGNDFEIISMIRRHRDQARWFSFGTGNSVNRFLIDKIAAEGGGEADYVLLDSSAEEAGKKFYDRISSPVLTDIKVEFGGVAVKDVFPKDVADLWAQRPLYFSGRYTKPGTGKVVLTGYSGGKPYRQEMKIDLPEKQDANDVIPAIWARAKVDRLMSEDWLGVQSGNINIELKEEIVATALKYHIMSQYTSFVAVEEDRSTGPDKAKLVPVPVEHAEGVNGEATRSRLQAKMPNGSHAVPSSGVVFPVRAGAASSGSYSRQGVGMGGNVTSFPSFAAGGGGGGYGYGLSSGSASLRGAGMGLPPTSMGKFVHQPGDNQYSPMKQYAASSPKPAQLNSFVKTEAEGSYGGGSLDGSIGAGYGTAGGALNSPMAMQARSVNTSAVRGRLLDRRSNSAASVSSHEESASRDKSAQKKEQKQDVDKNKGAEQALAKVEDLSSSKIDAALRALAESILKDGKNSDKLVNGRLKVSIELNAPASAKLISKLQKLGFHVSKQNGKLVLGKIAPKSLSALALLEEVLSIKLDT